MDPGRSMIDIRSLAAVQWDYLPEVVDAGMTPAYQAYLISHPFPRFTDPLGVAGQAQGQVPQQRQIQQQQQPPAQAQAEPQVRHRVQQVAIPPRQMVSDPGASGSGSG